MAQPAPRKSYLILILVVLAAFVVIIAKTSAKHKAGPNPQSQTAQLPAESPVAKIAAAVPADSTTVGAPEPAPPAQPPAADEPEATAKPTPPSEAAPAPKPEPAAGQPSAPAAAGAKPKPPASPEAEPTAPQEPAKKEVQPLPGSKLAECLKSGRPTMVDFGAGWCRPCQMMEPVLVQAATKYEGKANVVYVDTDKYADVARSYRIASIPTQIFFDAKGEKVSQHIGYWPIEDVGRALAAAGVAE